MTALLAALVLGGLLWWRWPRRGVSQAWLLWWRWPRRGVSQAWLLDQDRRDSTRGIDQVCGTWPIRKTE